MLLAVFVLTRSEMKNTWSGLVTSTWEFHVCFCLINMELPGGASEDAAPACRSQGEMKQIHPEEVEVARLALGISGSSTSNPSQLWAQSELTGDRRSFAWFHTNPLFSSWYPWAGCALQFFNSVWVKLCTYWAWRREMWARGMLAESFSPHPIHPESKGESALSQVNQTTGNLNHLLKKGNLG